MDKKVVVIGGGLGGISAAISLRCLGGYDVELYEKNSHLGGKLNQLETEGYSFDLGPSIFTFPHIFEKLFEMAGEDMEDYLQLVEPDVHWRCFFEDGEQLDLLPDTERMVAANETLSRADVDDLEAFLDYSKDIYENVEKGYFNRGADTLWQVLKTTGLFDTLFGFDVFSTMHQGVSRKIDNPKLAHVLDFFAKYVGSSPYEAPAILNMIPYSQFEFGLWYVQGGMYNLARALEKLMESLEVEVHLDTEITELDHANGAINSARTAAGETLEADVFVSNMEVLPAYRELTGESDQFMQKYEKFEPACSGLVLHLGVEKQFDGLAHHNFFFSGDPEKHFDQVFNEKILPDDPTIYLVAPSRTNPDVAPAGCDNIKVLPHIPHLQNNSFTDKEYAELKERVLDKLERMGLEGLRENTVVEDTWTPEDIREKYYSNGGAIYGVVSDQDKNRGFKAPKSSDRYANLYFVGGSVNPGGGMPMVVLSGQQAAQEISRKYG